MGRPTLHPTEHLLDTAAALAVEQGPARVTMAAVARAAGAPSGTLYHRFENRGALLGAVWLRTVHSFHDGYLQALGDDPGVEGCVAAARYVITWSRVHEAGARILLRGAGEMGLADWPAGVRADAEELRREVDLALGRAARAIGGPRRATLERVVLATVDIPYALLRRHLEAGTLPAGAEDLVEVCVRALLEPA